MASDLPLPSPLTVDGLAYSPTAPVERVIPLPLTRIQRGGWCGLHYAHRRDPHPSQ